MNSPVFLDTSCFIYLLEDNPRYSQNASEIFDKISLGKIKAFSSIITLTEILTKPYQQKNSGLISRYLEFLGELENFELLIPDYHIAIEAAKIRGKIGINLPDAYQLAMAKEAGCKSFLTNDKNLKKFKEIEVILLNEITS